MNPALLGVRSRAAPPGKSALSPGGAERLQKQGRLAASRRKQALVWGAPPCRVCCGAAGVGVKGAPQHSGCWEGALGSLGAAVWSRMSYCSNQAPLQLVTPPPHVWVPEQGPLPSGRGITHWVMPCTQVCAAAAPGDKGQSGHWDGQ